MNYSSSMTNSGTSSVLTVYCNNNNTTTDVFIEVSDYLVVIFTFLISCVPYITLREMRYHLILIIYLIFIQCLLCAKPCF